MHHSCMHVKMNGKASEKPPFNYLVIADCCTVAVAHAYQIQWACRTRLVCNNRYFCSIQWVWRRKLLPNRLLNLIANYQLQNQALGYRVATVVVFPVRCSAFEIVLVVASELKLQLDQFKLSQFWGFFVCVYFGILF